MHGRDCGDKTDSDGKIFEKTLNLNLDKLLKLSLVLIYFHRGSDGTDSVMLGVGKSYPTVP